MSELEFYLLFGIYGLTAVALVSIWVYGHKKSIRVDQDYLLINSMFGLDRLEPGNIRKIAQFQTHQGQEGVYIKTENKVYYLNDQYFPFPELLTDLERFVAEHGIRTNFSSN